MGKRYLLSIGPFLLSAQSSFATFGPAPPFLAGPLQGVGW